MIGTGSQLLDYIRALVDLVYFREYVATFVSRVAVAVVIWRVWGWDLECSKDRSDARI